MPLDDTGQTPSDSLPPASLAPGAAAVTPPSAPPSAASSAASSPPDVRGLIDQSRKMGATDDQIRDLMVKAPFLQDTWQASEKAGIAPDAVFQHFGLAAPSSSDTGTPAAADRNAPMTPRQMYGGSATDQTMTPQQMYGGSAVASSVAPLAPLDTNSAVPSMPTFDEFGRDVSQPDAVQDAVTTIASRVGQAVLSGWRDTPDLITPMAQTWLANHETKMFGMPSPLDVLTVGKAVLAAGNAVFQGGLAGIAALGDAVGQPQLGRDVAGYYEAMGMTGAPHFPAVLRPTMPETRAMLTERSLADAKPPAADAVAAIGKAPDVNGAIAAAGEAVAAPVEGPAVQYPAFMGDLPARSFAPAGEGPVLSLASDQTLSADNGGGTAQPATETPTSTPAPAPQSLGAAAAAPGEITMPPDEFAANRLQGEVERLAAPPRRGDATVYIPDVKSTLAEVSGDPVAAMDQAYNRQQPEAMTAHAERESATADLVAAYYADTAGSAQELLRMERAKDARAAANIDEVFGAADAVRPPADATPVIEGIDQVLDHPRQQERDAVRSLLTNLRDRFFNDDGTMKTDPYSLYGIRDHIGDLLNGVGNTETSSAARVIQRELMQIREGVDNAIEAAVPGFAKFRAEYSRDSGQIAAMKMLQDERLSLLSGTAQHITPAKWFNFMRGIVEGRADPFDPASSLSEGQMDRLWNITDQLKRQTLIDAGKPRGSWTSMMQEWGGRFARLGAHAVAGYASPVVGNALVEMGVAGLRKRSVAKEMNRALNPDLSRFPQYDEPSTSVGASSNAAAAPPTGTPPITPPAAPAAANPIPAGTAATDLFNRPSPESTPAQTQLEREQAAVAAMKTRAEQARAAPAPTSPGSFYASTTALTPASTPVAVRYVVREANDLTPSQTPDGRPNPAFPPELQPRDRTRNASLDQVNYIANTLQPEKLGYAADTATGAPVVGPDGFVESGNGRTMAIQQAYAEGGTAADSYRTWLAGQGFDISGMRQPVLVRERTAPLDMTARAQLADEMGASPTMAMAAPERAAADAKRIPTDVLSLIQRGDVTSVSNAPFVRAFANHAIPASEHASFMTADGDLSAEGATRVRNALTQRAYGSNALVTSLAENADPELKAFGGALVDAAGPMAKLRGAIEAGTVDAANDLTGAIIEASRLIQTARRAKIGIADAVAQTDAFSQRDPSTEMILRATFGKDYAGRMSRPKFAGLLADFAAKMQEQSGLFGEGKTAEQVFEELSRK